jgi:hypothetical protein
MADPPLRNGAGQVDTVAGGRIRVKAESARRKHHSDPDLLFPG